MKPTEIFQYFDTFLAARGLSFEAVVIGGAALACLGVIARETRDCDVLDPTIPHEIEQAAQELSLELANNGLFLHKEWLNNGPASLKEVLPRGWQARIVPLFKGHALFLSTLGRKDLLKTKLFAYCDRGQDLSDCVALNPTKAELDEAIDWVIEQDAHPDWPKHVKNQFAHLIERLPHGL